MRSFTTSAMRSNLLIIYAVKLYGELPESAKINETGDGMEGGDEECGFEFGGEGDEDDELDIDDI